MKYLKFSAILLLFSFSFCKKDPNQGLTAETQTGANTFSCKINSKLFTPKQSLFGPMPLIGRIDKKILDGARILVIEAINNDLTASKIEINIDNFNSTGRYDLDYANNNRYAEYVYEYNMPSKTIYSSKSTNIGYVNITKSSDKIISGTFEFTLSDLNNVSNTSSVTSGRFDIPL